MCSRGRYVLSRVSSVVETAMRARSANVLVASGQLVTGVS